jgi:anti-sigma factor RsiW
MPDPIRTNDQPHDEAEALLPWYATGQLDAADRALVEQHLASCPQCQRQLSVERRLVDEFQAYSPEVDSGWARLRARIEPPRPVPARRELPNVPTLIAGWWLSFSRPAVAGLVAAQLAFVVVAGGLVLSLNRAPYQALSAPPVTSSANIIVMFRPNSSEADLRKLLETSGATFAGGPTEADAYLLRAPAETRPRALAALRADPNVTMAQPIDGDRP